jgi:hypothetical protein
MAKKKSAVLQVNILSDYNPKGVDAADRSFEKLHKGAMIASTAIVAGVGAASKKAISDASALSESVNAVNVVFGDASDKIAAFGKTSSSSVGMSQRAFNELATKTGSLLQNFGYSADDAADSTIKLADRAADMASVFNTDVDSAMAAIEAGLRGQNEQLLNYGVSIDASTVKAKALEMGLADATGAIDAQAEALAVEALIMEQTAAIAGDFDNTSGQLANSQRTLQADVENLSAQFGTALLPVMESVVAVLSSVVAWMSENSATVTTAIGVITALAAAYLTANVALGAYNTVTGLADAATKTFTAVKKANLAVTVAETAKTVAYNAVILATKTVMIATTAATQAWTAAQKLLNLAMRANPIGIIITVITALVAIVIKAYQSSDTFRAIVDKLWRLLKNSVVGAFNAVSGAIEKIVGWLKKAWEWVNKVLDKFRQVTKPKFLSFGFGSSAVPAGIPVLDTAAPAAPRATAGAPISITINGAVDPVATAEQIRRLLGRQDARMGRPVGIWGLTA